MLMLLSLSTFNTGVFGAFSFFFLLKVGSETKKERQKVKILLRGAIFHFKKSTTKKTLFMSFKITAGFLHLINANSCLLLSM